jgi:cathepsin L
MLLLLVWSAASVVFTGSEERSFLSWMRSVNQIFTGPDYQMRFSLWLSSYRYVQQHNSKGSTFTVALNDYAAYSPSEYHAILGFRPDPNHKPMKRDRPQVLELPNEKNWLSSVSPVQNQGSCSSDWAIVAVGAVESAWHLSGRPLCLLSAQNLIDCVSNCFGCKGGNVALSYQYVLSHQNGFFANEEAYPKRGFCQWEQVKNPQVRIRSVTPVFEGDEEDLARVIASVGPVAAAIDASHKSFQMYKSGVYDEPECSQVALNHAVLVVGYSKTYWIVKNSQGTQWGMEGYIYMARGKGNQCGIASMGFVPNC